ncbi:hypothetical protein TSUD_249180 [Trifolium subterraneum]|nr:hypothetical protein TSUD_249180 [Trifolium subterraneum]
MFYLRSNSRCFLQADAGVLQLQNQQLVQETEIQKQALHEVEDKTRELKERQKAYDDILITFNQHWDQLVDDMALLGIQAGRGKDSLQTLDYPDNPQGSLPSCPPDDLFLCRLIQKDCIEGSSNNEIINYVEEALALRRLSTTELLKLIQDTVDDQMERIEDIGQVLHGDLSTEDAVNRISKIDDMTKKEVDNFHEVIDTLHAKHKEYTVGIQNYIDECLRDQSVIKRLTGI